MERSLNLLPLYPLWGAEQRAKRARVHIAALEKRVRRWVEKNAQAIVNADDAAEAALALGVQEFFSTSSLWIGDAIYNLRSALDYVVYDFAVVGAGMKQVKNTQFPICDRWEDFDAMLTGKHPETGRPVVRRMRHVPGPVVDRFRQLQPCATPPCRWTRVLRELSNPDKHRNLTNVRATGRMMRGDHPELPPYIPASGRTVEKYHFIAGFYFERTEVDVIETLKVLQREVSALIEEFKPAFQRTGNVFQVEYEAPLPL